MQTSLKGKNVIITGGNRGIGKAIAFAFAKEGANIVFTYHTGEEEAKTTLKEIEAKGVKCGAMYANLILAQDREHLIQESIKFFGEIDILVNNAGVAARRYFVELTPDDVDKVMSINFFAPLYLSQLVAKNMIRNQEEMLRQNKPLNDYSIINISSISSELVVPGLAHYEASKAALTHLSKSISIELARFKIRVNCVAPGYIPTDINRLMREKAPQMWQQRINETPLGRAGEPDEIADGVLFFAKNQWATGTTLTIDGGRSRNWFGAMK